MLSGTVLPPVEDGAIAHKDAEQREEQRAYVRELARLTRLSVTQLAKLAGLSPSTLNRFLNENVSHMLSARTLVKVRDAAERIIVREGKDPNDTLPVFTNRQRLQADDDLRNFTDMSADNLRRKSNVTALPPRDPIGRPGDMIPVRVARGGSGREMTITDDEIDRTPRPSTLANVKEAYAVLLSGDSLVPRFMPGAILHVNPWRHPRPQQPCIVYLRNGMVLAKIFLRLNAQFVELLEFEEVELGIYRAAPFTVARGDVHAIHTIVSAEEP